ncbi:LOW QUALITY PROTEIN: hypothetical protein PHMEG_00021259 [Phytophthora megakarya]|uniref:Uncharacterized protein n=1 Tax=Phytophthora megakarya TaxID=4795 RepID=A0A225VLN8_9STRA|nr:LOW QUALITY PROTEIN: hypothetical protein PHMEG_00021259 [Phytophthora megakarya]
MPSKSNNYGIRFYAAVGWDAPYVHYALGQRIGKQSTIYPAPGQSHVLLRTSLYNTLRSNEVASVLGNDSLVSNGGSSSHLLRSPSVYRLTVSCNFYTMYTFAKVILAFTEGEVHTIITWNKQAVEAADMRVDEAERDEWELVAAVHLEPGWKEQEEDHNNTQKCLPKA